MFRGTTTKPELKNFGAGSIMKLGNDSYLVVAEGNQVSLLNLETFQRNGQWVEVENVYFLSEEDARELGNMVDGVTFSDYELLPRGFKELKFVDATPAHGAGTTSMRNISGL